MTMFLKEGPIDNTGNGIVESHVPATADHAENCDEDEDDTKSSPVAPRCTPIDDATNCVDCNIPGDSYDEDEDGVMLSALSPLPKLQSKPHSSLKPRVYLTWEKASVICKQNNKASAALDAFRVDFRRQSCGRYNNANALLMQIITVSSRLSQKC
jgi:hypothetical protein